MDENPEEIIKQMKRLDLVMILIIAVVMIQCASHKMEYNIAADMSPENKDLLMSKIDEGKKLFKAHCSGCHGVLGKGKDSIPNFTQRQVDFYKELSMREDPKSHLVAMKLSQEQMDYIFTFLTFRKIKDELRTPDPYKKE